MLSKKAVEIFKKSVEQAEGEIAIVGHYDCDGICSSLIISKLLNRLNKKNSIFNIRSLDISFIDFINSKKFNLTIFADIGSGYIDIINRVSCSVIIIDHHKKYGNKREGITEINSFDEGFDGSNEICSSSMCYDIACTINKNNMDLCFIALAGVIADRQHIPNLSGYNKQVFSEAFKKGFLVKYKSLGNYFMSPFDNLLNTFDPYLIGYSNSNKSCEDFFNEINMTGKKRFHEYSLQSQKIIIENYRMKLEAQGVNPNFLSSIVSRYVFPSLQIDINEYSYLIDFLGREGNFSAARGVCINEKSALAEGRHLVQSHSNNIFAALKNINFKVLDKVFLNCLEVEDSNIKGILCGVLFNSLDLKNKVILFYSLHKEICLISSRCDYRLLDKRIDLSEAISKSSQENGGTGGGHAISAGARVPRNKFTSFIKTFEDFLIAQMS